MIELAISIPEDVYEDFTRVHGIGYVTKNSIRVMEDALLNGKLINADTDKVENEV